MIGSEKWKRTGVQSHGCKVVGPLVSYIMKCNWNTTKAYKQKVKISLMKLFL